MPQWGQRLLTDGNACGPEVFAAMTASNVDEWPTEVVAVEDIADLIRDWYIDDKQATFERFFGSEMLAYAGSPIEGGMNSGSSMTLEAFRWDDVVYAYDWDWDGYGEWRIWASYTLGDDEAKTEFDDSVVSWIADSWGYRDCSLGEDFPTDRLPDVRAQAPEPPWRTGVLSDYFKDVDDDEIVSLAHEASEDLQLPTSQARSMLVALRDDTADPSTDTEAARIAWWVTETQIM